MHHFVLSSPILGTSVAVGATCKHPCVVLKHFTEDVFDVSSNVAVCYGSSDTGCM